MMEALKYYKNKRVLITGHTGFKGSWLAIWLNLLGAEVIGIALDPQTKKDNFVLSGIKNKIKDDREDIINLNGIKKIIDQEKPEILFHLAAQPLVLESYENPVLTYETNVMGTVNLLEAFRFSDSLKTGVFITTDKCYENKEWVYGYREDDPMGGQDPYSSSKGAAELAIRSYRNSYFQGTNKKIASVRAGNVIGGGDWSPNRLVVDIVKSIEQDIPVEIRNPEAIRPWQHVLEPLSGYLLLGQHLLQGKTDCACGWNFGPPVDETVTVVQMAEQIKQSWDAFSFTIGSTTDQPVEATRLKLDCSKARAELAWSPVWQANEALQKTIAWYQHFYTQTTSMALIQIQEYVKDGAAKGLAWTRNGEI